MESKGQSGVYAGIFTLAVLAFLIFWLADQWVRSIETNAAQPSPSAVAELDIPADTPTASDEPTITPDAATLEPTPTPVPTFIPPVEETPLPIEVVPTAIPTFAPRRTPQPTPEPTLTPEPTFTPSPTLVPPVATPRPTNVPVPATAAPVITAAPATATPTSTPAATAQYTAKSGANAHYRISAPNASRMYALAEQWLSLNTGKLLGGGMGDGKTLSASFENRQDADTLMAIMQLGDPIDSSSASSGGLQFELVEANLLDGFASVRVYTDQNPATRADAFGQFMQTQNRAYVHDNNCITLTDCDEAMGTALVRAFTAEPIRINSGRNVRDVRVYFLARPSQMLEESILVLDVTLPNATDWKVVDQSMQHYGFGGYDLSTYKGETVMSTTTGRVNETLKGLIALGGSFRIVAGRFNPEDGSMALSRIVIRLR